MIAFTEEKGREDIDYMIKNGYFEGAYINEGSNELILRKEKSQEGIDAYSSVCPARGAKNTIVKKSQSVNIVE